MCRIQLVNIRTAVYQDKIICAADIRFPCIVWQPYTVQVGQSNPKRLLPFQSLALCLCHPFILCFLSTRDDACLRYLFQFQATCCDCEQLLRNAELGFFFAMEVSNAAELQASVLNLYPTDLRPNLC